LGNSSFPAGGGVSRTVALASAICGCFWQRRVVG